RLSIKPIYCCHTVHGQIIFMFNIDHCYISTSQSQIKETLMKTCVREAMLMIIFATHEMALSYYHNLIGNYKIKKHEAINKVYMYENQISGKHYRYSNIRMHPHLHKHLHTHLHTRF
ncbi:hypothetical protein ACJX0J_022322, partial [Zea mays]